MPELPEVETVRDGLVRHAVGGVVRDVEVLRAANATDGLKPVSESVRTLAKAQFKALQAGASVEEARAIRVTKPAIKAPKAQPAKPAKAPEVKAERASSGTKAERKAAKRRSKAGRKAYATRLANGNAVRVNGRFVSTKPAQPAAQVAAPVDEFETFAAPLRTVGLTNKQIKRAWAARPGV